MTMDYKPFIEFVAELVIESDCLLKARGVRGKVGEALEFNRINALSH